MNMRRHERQQRDMASLLYSQRQSMLMAIACPGTAARLYLATV
jgi:hypothetical protein